MCLICLLGLTYPVQAKDTKKETVSYTISQYAGDGSDSPIEFTAVSGQLVRLKKNSFHKGGYVFCGWTAYRMSDKRWFTKAGWLTADAMKARGMENYIFNDRALLRDASRVEGDRVIFFAQWKKRHIEAVNHRGWYKAPSETIAAYKQSLKQGFTHLDGDIRFTKDGVAVLNHDKTVDDTSNGSGLIRDMTLKELKKLDFGSYKSLRYFGQRIVTLEEFFAFCQKHGCSTDLELKQDKSYTKEEILSVVSLAEQYDMADKVYWGSKAFKYLRWILEVDPDAHVGIVRSVITSNTVYTIAGMRNGQNTVFVSARATKMTKEILTLCKIKRVDLALWTIDDEETIKRVDPYVSSVISNRYNARKVLGME